MSYLIDTDIIVYSLKGDEAVIDRFEETRNVAKVISVITCGELVYGARKSKHIQKNLATTRRVSELFPMIPITGAILDIFGEIKAELSRKGLTVDDMDLLIGATALTHNLTLVTNNVRYFEKIQGLQIENWTK